MEDLQFFDVVCRHNTLAKAAEALGVSPPAVTKRLANLEKRLGVTLISRTTRQLHLTPEGEQYVAEGRALLDQLTQLENQLSGTQANPKGWLKVNASFAFGRQHMGPALWQFKQKYPAIKVNLTLSDTPLDLANHGLDVAIRFGVTGQEDVIAVPLASHKRILCAAPSYVAKVGQPTRIEHLIEHDCVVVSQPQQPSDEWLLSPSDSASGRAVRTKIRPAWVCNEGEVAVRWAIQGAGVLLRSQWDIQHVLARRELVRVMPDWEGAPADVFAAYPPYHRNSPKVKAFVEFFKEYLSGVHFGADE